MKSVSRRSCASCDLAEMLHVLSAVTGIGILNVECAVRPSSRRTEATADVATAITFFSRRRRKSWMARVTNVLPVPSGKSRKKTRDSAFVVHRSSTQRRQDYPMTHVEVCSPQQHQTQLSDPHSISESPHRPLAAVSQCQVLPPLLPLSDAGRSSCGVGSWNVSKVSSHQLQ